MADRLSFGLEALDDPALREGAGAHQGGRRCDAHEFGKLLIGNAGVRHQRREQALIDRIERFAGPSRPNILRTARHGSSLRCYEFIISR